MELNETLQSIDQTLSVLEKNVKAKNSAAHLMKARPVLEQKSDLMEYSRKVLENFMRGNADETKGLSGLPDQMGRFLLPHPVIQRVELQLHNLSPVRQVARISSVNGEGADLILDHAHSSCGWTTEAEAGSETDVQDLKRMHIGLHTMYARPRVSQRLLSDSLINLEEWLIEKISNQMARFENAAFTLGDGIQKPKGFLSYGSGVAGKRRENEFEHILTGEDGGIGSSDVLIDAVGQLDTPYHGHAVWMMPRGVLSMIRRLKDQNGQFLWQPSLAASIPSTLLGYPIVLNDDMPVLNAGKASKSIVFGSFYDAYQIVEHTDISVLRDPYSVKPFVEFYATKRLGGDVINFDALKVIHSMKG